MASSEKLKGILRAIRAEEEALRKGTQQLISFSSTYRLPGQHSERNTQLVEPQFMTPIVCCLCEHGLSENTMTTYNLQWGCTVKSTTPHAAYHTYSTGHSNDE